MKVCPDELLHLSAIVKAIWTEPQLPDHINLKELL